MKRILVILVVLLAMSTSAFANPFEENKFAKEQALIWGNNFAVHEGPQPKDIEEMFEFYPRDMALAIKNTYAPWYSIIYRPPLGSEGWGIAICARQGTACYIVTEGNAMPVKKNMQALENLFLQNPGLVREVYKNVMVVFGY